MPGIKRLRIPLQIMNLSDTSKTIEMGTAVGKLSPVDKVLTFPIQSQNAIGAASSQVQDGKERVVAYASKVLSKSERKYCMTRKVLAVVTLIKHFRPFWYGHKFLVRGRSQFTEMVVKIQRSGRSVGSLARNIGI
jgi:hypothetical protein